MADNEVFMIFSTFKKFVFFFEKFITIWFLEGYDTLFAHALGFHNWLSVLYPLKSRKLEIRFLYAFQKATFNVFNVLYGR